MRNDLGTAKRSMQVVTLELTERARSSSKENVKLRTSTYEWPALLDGAECHGARVSCGRSAGVQLRGTGGVDETDAIAYVCLVTKPIGCLGVTQLG